MIGLLGYNFFADSDCANPSPTYIADVNDTTIQNGIFNHFNIDSSVSFEYSDTIPDKWDFSTVMNANFEGNINAGNLSDIAANITGYRIKRRVKGDFDWVTLKEETISDISSKETMALSGTHDLSSCTISIYLSADSSSILVPFGIFDEAI